MGPAGGRRMKPDLETLFRNSASLPSLHGVAVQIVRLANDRDADIRAVAEAISMDPALAGKVLRFVNSPMYAKQREVESLRQAIVIMGLNATMSLALSFSLVSSMREQEGTGLDYSQFWRRTLVAGVAAKVLGTMIDELAIEELFLAALLQDIGMLALDKGAPDFYADLGAEQFDHEKLYAYEQQRLGDGQDHSDVGARLLEEWNLPERTVLAVKVSHAPAEVPLEDSLGRFVRCVALGGMVADLFVGESPEAQYVKLGRQARDLLEMDQDTVDEVLHRIASLIPDVESLFNFRFAQEKSPAAILEQAREALVIRNLEAMRVVGELRDTAESLQTHARNLEESSRRDALTGVYNRGYLETCLADAFERAERRRAPLTIVFADLDRFKTVNDTHGHPVGDRVLKAAAKLLKHGLRPKDVVTRYGGEEFVLVMPDSGGDEAKAVCERIVDAFRAYRHPVGPDRQLAVTVSLGIATHGEACRFASAEELVRAADTAVYEAKVRGRDRVCVYE